MPVKKWKPRLADTIRPLLPRDLDVDGVGRTRTPDGVAHDAVIASYNVHKCVGQDGQFDPARTVAVIAELGADVVALQEVDKRFGDRVGLLDLDYLRECCGLRPIPLTPTRKGHGWHGNLVLCREGEVRFALQIALPGGEPRGALVVEFELPQGPLRIVAAHLGLLRRSRALQVKSIVEAITKRDDMPTLLMGDLNEWRLGELSSLRGLDEAFPAPAPLIPSFPAGFPVLALDRIISNRAGLVAAAGVHDSPLSRVASDHLPIKAWVDLATGGGRQRIAA